MLRLTHQAPAIAARTGIADMPGGRPSIFSEELAAEIIERMIDGESLRKICRDDHMPNAATVLKWVATDKFPGFAEQYARAMEARADALFEESFEIVDDGSNDWIETNDPENPGYRLNGEHVQRSKLRVEYRKWAASKMSPKKYGDKQQLEVAGKDGGAIQTQNQTVTMTAEEWAAIAKEAASEF